MFYIPFFVLLIILIAIVMLKAVKIVPESQVYIVEKLGKYYQSLSSGLNVWKKFMDLANYDNENIKRLKETSFIVFLIKDITSLAWVLVAVFPVPIAHIGS